MRFLSVAERELRATARRPWFFRARWITAAAFFGLLLWLAWVYDLARNRRSAVEVFEAYSAFILIYCLLAGATSTADCRSREKREGTLGLLFLSNVSSAEIVGGKICSSSLTLLYSLLAIFPLLALPVLLGGITFADFWCSVLALVNALFFAMSAGFIASALCVRQFPAVAVATALALFFGLAWLGIMKLLRSLGWPAEVTDVLGNFCPLKTLDEAARSRSFFGRAFFWDSLISVAALSLSSLVLVSWWTARTWRDRPKRARRSFWPGVKPGTPQLRPARIALRRRLLAINPFLWLASRHRVGAPVFMVVSVVLVLFTVWVTAPYFGNLIPAGTMKPVAGYVFAWLWTGLAIHLLTLYYAATAASQRLAEDKQTGALELILSTPTTERTIARGLWLAYARRMFFPVVLATLVHCFFIWQGAVAFTMEPIERLPLRTTPAQLLWAAWSHGSVHGIALHWVYGFLLRVLLSALLLCLLLWITLGWVGRWLGLRMKRPGFAPLVALGLTLIPPVLLFSLACYLADELNVDRLPERLFFPLMLWTALGIGVAHCLALSIWAATRLRQEFRATVMSRYQPVLRRAWWRSSLKIFFRIAAGWIALALVTAAGIFLYFGNQNHRSNQRWAAFQKAHGASLNLATVMPGPMAGAENFVTSPAFRSLLHQKPQDKSAVALNRSAITRNRGPYNYYSGNDPLTPWTHQAFLDFAEQLDSKNQKSRRFGPLDRTNAALEILDRLKPLEPSLSAIATAAAERPRFQVRTNSDASAVLDTQSSELSLLDSLHGYFQLRACARLETGQAASAAEDVLTGLRLAGLAAQASDAQSSVRAQLLFGRSIQPVWEGLARRAWSEPEIAAIQHELMRFNLLANYTNNVQRAVLANIATWQEIARSSSANSLQFVNAQSRRGDHRWQPRSWWYDNAIELYEAGQITLTNVNAAAGWMKTPDQQREIYELPLDSETSQLLQQANWWGNNFSVVAFAQTALNEAIVACALERHRLAHGQYPESLDALVAGFLPRIPTDVPRGRPLLYQVTNGCYRLFGVGPNNRDDRDQKTTDDWIWSFGTNAPPAGAK